MSKSLSEMTIGELWAEYHHWNDKICASTGWGAALAAAAEFRRDTILELRRRGEINALKGDT